MMGKKRRLNTDRAKKALVAVRLPVMMAKAAKVPTDGVQRGQGRREGDRGGGRTQEMTCTRPPYYLPRHDSKAAQRT
jgi:hypothetical protein